MLLAGAAASTLLQQNMGCASLLSAGHHDGFVATAAIPVHQQPDMIMLLPKLLEPADHVLAATLLVQRMVELQARGAEAEALLRLPVLATLALLSVEGDAAKAVVAAALRVSCMEAAQSTADSVQQIMQTLVFLLDQPDLLSPTASNFSLSIDLYKASAFGSTWSRRVMFACRSCSSCPTPSCPSQ